MYTVLITQDNSVIATEKEAILEKSSLVDTLQFIVEKEYNGYDMKDFQLVIQAYAPVTHEIHVEVLEMTDENYKDLYYAYQLPLDTRFTAEPGEVLYSLSFSKSVLDADGKVFNYVRNISQGSIKVLELSDWFVAPDSSLSELTQILLANQQAISALRAVANQIQKQSPEDITVNSTTGEIYLLNDKKRVGTGITIATLKKALGIIDGDNSSTTDGGTTPTSNSNYLTVTI